MFSALRFFPCSHEGSSSPLDARPMECRIRRLPSLSSNDVNLAVSNDAKSRAAAFNDVLIPTRRQRSIYPAHTSICSRDCLYSFFLGVRLSMIDVN